MADRSRNSRQLLANAARAEFAEHGFAGARTDRIVQRAGVNKQLLFYYFGSKAGLYEAVMRRAEAELTDASPKGDVRSPHAAGRLRAQLKAIYQALAEQPELTSLVIHGVEERSHAPDPPAAPAPNGAIRTFIQQLAHVISEGQGLGYFRDDADPEAVARQGVVLLLGYFALEGALTYDRADRHRADWLDSVVDLLIRGLAW